jgi:hypothetical protein
MNRWKDGWMNGKRDIYFGKTWRFKVSTYKQGHRGEKVKIEKGETEKMHRDKIQMY